MVEALEVKNLTKVFQDRKVVDNLSFVVPQGEILGFIGPNGSGKTTTIKMICGLLRPTEGTAVINGCHVVRQPKEARRALGYMSQQFSLYPFLSVEQNIEFYGRLYGLTPACIRKRKQEMLELTGLAAYRQHEPRCLSGGWKQRLALACALVHDPSLLILDQPTAGVDPVARRALWNLIVILARAGKTFFVSTHSTEDVEQCHTVGYLHRGKLLALGTPQELRSLRALRQRHIRHLEVVASDPVAVLEYVRSKEHFFDASTSGRGVQAQVSREMTLDAVEAELEQAVAGELEVHTFRPCLEDIFVTLTQLEESGLFGRSPAQVHQDSLGAAYLQTLSGKYFRYPVQ